jgi:hypothetical protein
MVLGLDSPGLSMAKSEDLTHLQFAAIRFLLQRSPKSFFFLPFQPEKYKGKGASSNPPAANPIPKPVARLLSVDSGLLGGNSNVPKLAHRRDYPCFAVVLFYLLLWVLVSEDKFVRRDALLFR